MGGDATSITLSLVAIPAIVVFIWQRYQDTQAKHLSVASVSCFAVGSLLVFFFHLSFLFLLFSFYHGAEKKEMKMKKEVDAAITSVIIMRAHSVTFPPSPSSSQSPCCYISAHQ